MVPVATVCLVWLVAMAAFYPVRHFKFIRFDDDINIYLNPHLGRFDGTTVRWMLTDTHDMRRYIPAGWAGFALIYGLFGLDPHGYHWACLLLHGINVLLVIAICHEAIKRFGSRRVGGSWAVVSAALAGAWWAWHPLRVELVAWASGYLYVQALFFLLGSFYLYIARKEGAGCLRWWASAGFYLLSVSTYPVTLAYPAVLLCWEAANQQRRFPLWSPGWWRGFRPAMLKVLGWFGLVSISFGSMTLYASFHAGPLWSRPASLATLTFPVRMEHLVYAEGYNFWRPWWPFPPRLVANSLSPTAWRDEIFWVCALALIAVVWACFFLKAARRSGFWAVGAAYLFLVLPMAGLFDSIFFLGDRGSYFSSLPWTIALAVVLAACARPWLKITAVFVLAAILCGLLVLSRQWLGGWKDSETFFPTALRELSRPDGEKEHLYHMWANMLSLEGRFEEARAACAQGLGEFPFSKALSEQRRSIDQAEHDAMREGSWLRLAAPVPGLVNVHDKIALQKIQHFEWADAADHFRAALQISPDYYPARFKLAQVLVAEGKPNEALGCYLQAMASSHGRISDAERADFLLMLGQAGALNGDERLARVASEKGRALRAGLSH